MKSAREKERLYLLFAFVYPSGSGLHVGHVESKTALDIMARYYRMQGKEVFFPVGWDAFGLPAENYAIKTGVHPAETTKKAIDTFKRQIKEIGISYDWQREIATSHSGYYKWTQWLFLQLYKKGLAYQDMGSVNWCPSCQTVLANEQVIEGHCERCDTEVIQKEMKQWYFKITEYQDQLIDDLDQVDWPEATKQQQKNWVGRSEGANVKFQITNDKDFLEVYTTAHDTIFGCTFMVISPEHSLLEKHKEKIKNWQAVSEYITTASKKTELERQSQKKKTGIIVKGITLINPINGQEVPLFVADYVLMGYGTGAVMAVPGHDERDYEFATKYDLDIVPTAVLKGEKNSDEFISYSEIKQNRKKYKLINSGEFDGQDYQKGRQAILDKLINQKSGDHKTQYKLRDWLISRQRYWGAPIPIVYDPDGKAHSVKEEHLPWLLPEDVDFKPTGESPLKSSKEFLARTEKLYGKGWTPEYDTMDTFVCSSWYYLRYTDPRNEKEFASKENIKKWMPVDFYMIGPEHIVLHLLYSRFFTKFLRDEGYLDFDEPFLKMRHQGMILGPDGKKMSKSKGNVISPDDIIKKFGADTLRIYEMFMGPIEADKPWNMNAVGGMYRFLNRIERLAETHNVVETHRAVETRLIASLQAQENPIQNDNTSLQRKLHQTIKKVSQDIPKLKFNTAIAAMMEFINLWEIEIKNSKLKMSNNDILAFIKLLAPFAPFLAEKLHSSVHEEPWPKWDEASAQEEEISIPVQVNGKLRDQLSVETRLIAPVEARYGVSQEKILAMAKKLPKIQKWLEGEKIKKEIYVEGKIINIVTK